jgi:hypothetical protein
MACWPCRRFAIGSGRGRVGGRGALGSGRSRLGGDGHGGDGQVAQGGGAACRVGDLAGLRPARLLPADRTGPRRRPRTRRQRPCRFIATARGLGDQGSEG